MTDLGRAEENNPSFREMKSSPFVFFISLLFASAGIFGRGAGFHDEMINFAKAQKAVIFDYAARPAFYGINWLSLNIFGHSLFSLQLAATLAYALTCLLLFKIACKQFGLYAGYASIFIFGASTLIFSNVRAMPNLYVGAAIAGVVFFASQIKAGKTRYLYSCAAGVASVLAIGFHQTAIVVPVVLAGWFLFRWVINDKNERSQFYKSTELVGILSIAVSFLLYEMMFRVFYSSGYVGAYLHNISYAQDPAKYFDHQQPLDFYWRVLYADQPIVFAALLGAFSVLVFRIVLTYSTNKRDAVSFFASVNGLLLLLVLSGTLLIHVSNWKFGRILLNFYPMYILLILLGYDSFKSWAGSSLKWSNKVLIVLALGIFIHSASQKDFFAPTSARKFERIYNFLAQLPTKKVYYVGTMPRAVVINRYASLADKQMINLSIDPKQLEVLDNEPTQVVVVDRSAFAGDPTRGLRASGITHNKFKIVKVMIWGDFSMWLFSR